MNQPVKYQGAFSRIVGFAGKRFLFSTPPSHSIFFAPALTFAKTNQAEFFEFDKFTLQNRAYNSGGV